MKQIERVYNELNNLKNKYALKKNDNLKKYEIQIEEIDIDICVPYFSKLAIPVEDFLNNTTIIQGFKVVVPEILLILKQSAEIERKNTLKGKKDILDFNPVKTLKSI